MEFLGANSGLHMASGGSGAAGWSSSSFGMQVTGTAFVSGAADLLKQVEQLTAKSKRKILLQRKN